MVFIRKVVSIKFPIVNPAFFKVSFGVAGIEELANVVVIRGGADKRTVSAHTSTSSLS